MKSLKQIREASGGKEAYQKFFNSLLKKFGVKSPAELDDDKKKEFYDAIDKGWDGDNEKPEKNERYGDPDNLDPDTTTDPDEEEINAAYKMNAHKDKDGNKMHASYSGMNAGKVGIKSAYHKESVDEAKKLKGGKGKAEIDINWDGNNKDAKFAQTKYKIKLKQTRDGAILTGDKQKILAYLQGQDYDMDAEDIEDLYPELMEDRSPKPLSIIRANKISSDAVIEKMAMCEQCGKMHEEGACMETDITGDMDPETKGMKERAKGTASPKELAKQKDMMAKMKKRQSRREEADINEMNFDKMLGIKGKKKNTAPKDTEDAWDKYKRLSKNPDGSKKLTATQQAKVHRIADKFRGNMQGAMKEIERLSFFAQGIKDDPYVLDVLRRYNEDVNEDVNEANRFSKKLKGAAKDLFALSWKAGGKSKAYGDKEWDAAVDKMAAKYRDDNHVRISDKDIAAVKQAIKHESVSEAVDVDRRTVGFKAAMIRSEKAKKVREKSKAKKAAKKDQAELDARYDYDGEVDDIMAAASKVMMGTQTETAANSVASGNVDMNPTGKKKKKDDIMARRSY